jgi:hypothetical protein
MLGLFATMAQNGYGFTLMGLACFGLALLYFAQLSWKVIEDYSSIEKKDIIGLSELLLLSLLLLLFGFRVFYINIPFSDLIFITLCGLLIVTYFLITTRIIKIGKNKNPALAKTATFFYSSILIFLLSLGTRIINQSLSTVIGALGFITSIPFLISLLRRSQYDYSAGTITIFQFIVSSRNKAGMLFLFFTLSAFYLGLSNFRIIPGIENAEKPRTYIELRTQAETGKEKPVNGKYKYQTYKETMDKFLQRHGNKKAR